MPSPKQRPFSLLHWFGLVATIATGGLLIWAVGDFPDWGDPNSRANAGEVATYFVEHTERDTHVPNMVTAVLADYRGYDTMFETVVIFTAGLSIFAILRVMREKDKTNDPESSEVSELCEGDHYRIIVGTTCRILIPIVQLFGLYVIAHGHHSPGGGFQGGVILGASFIMYAVAKDLGSTLKRFSEKQYFTIAAIGILIYAGFGVLAQVLGENFLDYAILHKVMPATGEVMARSHSMLGVEVGVAFTVTAIMFAIYANLSTKGELENGL